MLIVKCGGALGDNVAAICEDLAQLARSGERIVLVHGGSTAANTLGERLGTPPRFLLSSSGVRSRYTDAATLDVLTQALTGQVNPMLVTKLLRLGVKAIGLSGVDGALVQARRKPAVRATLDGRLRMIRDDLTGRITQVNVDLLRMLLDAGYLPVISPPALDPEHGAVNVDADRMAAAVAVALGVNRLVLLSNVPGLLRDPIDPSTVIDKIPGETLETFMPLAEGRMKLKLIASGEAISGGVECVMIGDGRLPAPVYQALAGKGTAIFGANGSNGNGSRIDTAKASESVSGSRRSGGN